MSVCAGADSCERQRVVIAMPAPQVKDPDRALERQAQLQYLNSAEMSHIAKLPG